MKIKKIKLLAQLLEQSDLTVLEICEGDTRIRMERGWQTAGIPPAVLQPQGSPRPAELPAPIAQEAAPAFQQPSDVVDFNYLTEVKAPMVGVFYAAPSPEAEPYVRRGDRVKKGDVLCVIEAMKLLNEIVAEADGEITDICVQNGQIVEFSQTLFKLF